MPKVSVPTVKESPVTFPPGRARLATRPWPTGSATPIITMGIVPLAAFAAITAGAGAATSTSTSSRTSSAASAGEPVVLVSGEAGLKHSRSAVHVTEVRESRTESVDDA